MGELRTPAALIACAAGFVVVPDAQNRAIRDKGPDDQVIDSPAGNEQKSVW